MRKITLGGDRLGSGKRQKVELKGYERSTHDLSYIWRSTMSAGTLVPFMSIPALPGDTFDIKLNCDVKTHPTVGPLFGSFKVQLDTFFAPIRLYIAQLHNNKLGIGMNMSAVKLPIVKLTANFLDLTTLTQTPGAIDTSQINPSCILAYLGIRGVGMNSVDIPTVIQRNFNGVPLLMYWDIYKNYYANKQEPNGAVIHTPLTALVESISSIALKAGTTTAVTLQHFPGTSAIVAGSNTKLQAVELPGLQTVLSQVLLFDGINAPISLAEFGTFNRIDADNFEIIYDFGRWGTRQFIYWDYNGAGTVAGTGQIRVETFPLSNLDVMREAILQHPDPGVPFDVIGQNLAPYEFLGLNEQYFFAMMNSQEGLGLKTYQSDLFNNWLQHEWYDDIADITKVDTTGGFFTIDQLTLAKNVWQMLNRIAVSDGTYDSWQVTVYDHEPFARAETPMYMGGLIKELVFQEVVSNSESAIEGQPLGTLAGKGVMADKHKGGNVHIKADEIGYVMGIISLTPRIDYSQGNTWDTHLMTMDDFHKPQLDEIGFQDLTTEQMAWWNTYWDVPTSTWKTQSAGKQPAWINYMTDVNKTFGNFAIEGNEMFMTLNRRYRALDEGEIAGIDDLTTYIDPVKYNQIFAQTSLDSQNFWVQISVDIEARRKMSAKVMPNL